jgi:hypothetical protein
LPRGNTVSTERKEDEIRKLWQAQNEEEVTMSLEEIRRRASRFEKTILRRNAWEYAAGVFVVLFFGWHAFSPGEIAVNVGSGLIVAGTMYVGYQLYRRGSAETLPADSALTTCLDFHRQELTRQRDLLRGIWSWYLLPLVPGLLVFLGGSVLANPDRLWRVAPFALFCAALFFAIGKLNQNAARELQKEIDALDQYAGVR